jgi:hypothetical protein
MAVNVYFLAQEVDYGWMAHYNGANTEQRTENCKLRTENRELKTASCELQTETQEQQAQYAIRNRERKDDPDGADLRIDY